MSAQTKCRCQSCTIRGLMGPAILITLGILFLLNQTHGGRLQFDNTWPVILLVIGLILLASSLAPREGHINPPPQALPPAGVPPVPPVAPPQAPYSGQGQ